MIKLGAYAKPGLFLMKFIMSNIITLCKSKNMMAKLNKTIHNCYFYKVVQIDN